MKSLEPTERIRTIEGSLRCFVFGWLSLIPLAGMGFAVVALAVWGRLWMRSRGEWNPARNYLLSGFVLAWFGMIVSGGFAWLLLALLLNR